MYVHKTIIQWLIAVFIQIDENSDLLPDCREASPEDANMEQQPVGDEVRLFAFLNEQTFLKLFFSFKIIPRLSLPYICKCITFGTSHTLFLLSLVPKIELQFFKLDLETCFSIHSFSCFPGNSASRSGGPVHVDGNEHVALCGYRHSQTLRAQLPCCRVHARQDQMAATQGDLSQTGWR